MFIFELALAILATLAIGAIVGFRLAKHQLEHRERELIARRKWQQRADGDFPTPEDRRILTAMANGSNEPKAMP